MFDNQEDITSKMREHLFDWLLGLNNKYQYCTEVILTTYDIIDDYMINNHDIYLNDYKLIGLASFIIASKIYEPDYYNLSQILETTKNKYSRLTLLDMESKVFISTYKKIIFMIRNHPINTYTVRSDTKIDNVSKNIQDLFILFDIYARYRFGFMTNDEIMRTILYINDSIFSATIEDSTSIINNLKTPSRLSNGLFKILSVQKIKPIQQEHNEHGKSGKITIEELVFKYLKIVDFGTYSKKLPICLKIIE